MAKKNYCKKKNGRLFCKLNNPFEIVATPVFGGNALEIESKSYPEKVYIFPDGSISLYKNKKRIYKGGRPSTTILESRGIGVMPAIKKR